MPPQIRDAVEPPPAAPAPTIAKLPPADKLLLARVQRLVRLSIVLPRKGLAADGALERSLVGVDTQVVP